MSLLINLFVSVETNTCRYKQQCSQPTLRLFKPCGTSFLNVHVDQIPVLVLHLYELYLH